jgi:hypothetical protein
MASLNIEDMVLSNIVKLLWSWGLPRFIEELLEEYMSMSRVRELSEVLLQNAKYVHVSQRRAQKVAQALKDLPISLPTWDFEPFYPQSDDFEEMCLYYLVFNAINYCYFDQDGKKFKDGDYSGSALASLRLTENWDEISDPLFLSRVDENYLLAELFKAEAPISMVKERTHALRELGTFINSNPNFTFEKLCVRGGADAYNISQLIPLHLPSWRDPFFKRAQLFVGMVYGRFQNWGRIPIAEESLSSLTVFADYRVPQTLIAMGVIEPSASLLTRLHCEQFLGSGSRKELELRAATILGADAILEELQPLREERLNALHTDYLLWSAGRKKNDMPEGLFVKPFPNHHMTLTTDY